MPSIYVEGDDVRCPYCKERGNIWGDYCEIQQGVCELSFTRSTSRGVRWDSDAYEESDHEFEVRAVYCQCGHRWDSVEAFMKDTIGENMEHIPRGTPLRMN